jgi:hypothetical protein
MTHLQKAMVMGETRRETEAEAAPNQPETERKIASIFQLFLAIKNTPEAMKKCFCRNHFKIV